MKNLQRKALPDLKAKSLPVTSYLNFVNDPKHKITNINGCDYEEIAQERAEDFLFSVDKKISDYVDFMKNEMLEGIQEIVNQEFEISKKDISDKILNYEISNGDYNYDIDDNGDYYYISATAKIDMDDAANDAIKDAYSAISVESYKLSRDESEIL